jgi:hypothetical protein
MHKKKRIPEVCISSKNSKFCNLYKNLHIKYQMKKDLNVVLPIYKKFLVISFKYLENSIFYEFKDKIHRRLFINTATSYKD